ncbi:MAG: hypothetical protein HYY00_09065 [Chloroflexi bacterium]|nr:hypothetical protein [Chloroflexota bacterium]
MKHFYFCPDQGRDLERKLFRSWHNVLRKYEQAWQDNDLAYVYNQEANVGVLALAAWKIGRLPFLEFSVKKLTSPGRRRRYSGWGDLSIWPMEEGGKRGGILIEAERVQRSWKNKNDSMANKIRECLKKATGDASRISEWDARRMGLVFAIPFGARNGQFEPTTFWTTLVETRRSLKADFCAFHLCKRDIWSQQRKHKDCPGVAVIGKYIT